MNSDILLLLGKATLLLAAAILMSLALARANPRWRILSCELAAIAVLLLPLTLALPLTLQLPAEPTTTPPAPRIDAITIQFPELAASEPRAEFLPRAPVPAAAAPSPVSTAAIFTVLYSLGLATLVALFSRARRRLHRVLRSLEPADAASHLALEKIATQFALARVPNLLVTESNMSPFCCAHDGGTVVVPARLTNAANREELELVLLHELQHIANRDLPRVLLMKTVVALLWFHPLAWILCRCHALSIEELSDRVAASRFGKAAYRASLAKLALRLRTAPISTAPALGLLRTPQVIARLRRIARPRCHRPLGFARSGAIGALALALSFALCTLQIVHAEDAGDTKGSPETKLKLAAKLPAEQRAKISKAVASAFRAITAAQKENGMVPAKSDGTAGNEVATTALAAVAMLAHGGADGDSPYRKPMARAMEYVLSCQDEEGKFKQSRGGKFGNMYHHCVATWSIALLKDTLNERQQRKVEERLERAVQVILDAQAVDKIEINRGGWRYLPNSKDSDISVSAWAIRALSAAMSADVDVPQEATDSAMDYVARLQNKDGGFSYVAGAGPSSVARTAMGLHCVELVGDFRFAAEENALKYLQQHYKEPQKAWPYYTLFWLSSAYSRIGDIEEYAEWLFDESLPKQRNCRWRGGSAGDLLSTIFVMLAYAPPFD